MRDRLVWVEFGRYHEPERTSASGTLIAVKNDPRRGKLLGDGAPWVMNLGTGTPYLISQSRCRGNVRYPAHSGRSSLRGNGPPSAIWRHSRPRAAGFSDFG